MVRVQLPPMPDNARLLCEPVTTTRFWELPVPIQVIHACAGDPVKLAAWLVIAQAQREDTGLGLPPRSPAILAATAGQDLAMFAATTAALVADGLLIVQPDGRMGVPLGSLQMHAMTYAQSMREAVQALRTSSTTPAAAPLPLPLDS